MKLLHFYTLLGDKGRADVVRLELGGYFNDASPAIAKFRRLVGRDIGDEVVLYQPLPQLEHQAREWNARADQIEADMRLGKTGRQYMSIAGVNRKLSNQAQLIRHRVMTEFYTDVSMQHDLLLFENQVETMLDAKRKRIGALLVQVMPDMEERLTSIQERLAAGDSEARAQALNTCRRIIHGFANSVFPPSDTPAVEGEVTHDLRAGKHLNRVDEFLKLCRSKSRRDRLSTTLRLIHDRVSAGLKEEVSADEAASLVLATYLTLGEILEACASEVSELRPERPSRLERND